MNEVEMMNMLGLRYEMDEKNKPVLAPSYTQSAATPGVTINELTGEKVGFPFKYSEDRILEDMYVYLTSTYGEHYATDSEEDIQCFDAWIAMGDASPTFRNTAIKYLWRYGKKNGHNKKDLLKALHYIVLCLHNDHYKGKP